MTTGLLRVAETLLTRGRPGRALTLLARTPIPFITPDRFAELAPGRDLPRGEPSPLVEGNAARPATTGGLLDGGVVIKDQIDVAGMRTGVGLADGGALATRDAVLVARIVAAGGHIRGKAKMTELGIDGIGALMHYPMPRNPRVPGYIPGGSSTGTAVAVAAGLVRYGVGGDGLGSIRIPAAFCGLVGLKPTRTRIPREGIHSPVRTLDAVGPITRTVDDCARLWQVMAGEPVTPLSPAVPARIGVPILRAPWHVSRSVWTAFVRALAALTTEIEPIELRGLESVTFLGGMIGAHEFANGPFAGRTSSNAGRMSVALGRAFAPHDVARLERQREDLRVTTERVLERTPILAMPTTAIPPPALSRALLEGRTNLMLVRSIGAFTPLANLVDLPAIAVPCGVDDRDRPLSIMFVAARNHETDLLRLALALEHANLATRPVART